MNHLYGPIVVDLAGTKVASDEHAILQHPHTGAVLLFSRNYENRQQLIALTKEIRSIANKQLPIMVDHEGGRIWRFNTEFTRPDPAAIMGELYTSNPDKALAKVFAAGQIIASELLACGIDLTIAPVLDLNWGHSTVIGDRAFHADPQIVTTLAKSFIAGLSSSGMGAIGKHFPGHGYCTADTHDAIGKDNRSFELIAQQDMLPFANLHTYLSGIMPAHVIYPAVDPLPAGLSAYWLQTILRKQIGFTGVIISDCLSMKGLGAVQNFAEKAHQALTAGCDLVILTQQSRLTLIETLDQLIWQTSTDQQSRINKLIFSN